MENKPNHKKWKDLTEEEKKAYEMSDEFIAFERCLNEIVESTRFKEIFGHRSKKGEKK